ncbi:hypothetical protein BFP72_17515 [Reichenbachiella sp. 5M10]|uniref:hypothetical protein n=1 Tax=Reichenbachiella sp. 5M10 TaxID=1889772 RepID=UPI000C15407A|nr:hypothetical protein [Reichenbachiella sp. 5M10]PIB37073.1 hypothetical protein BFP72_17515 [Reichenbachiella sp. 5M10]
MDGYLRLHGEERAENLRSRIDALRRELSDIERVTRVFEDILRGELGDLIIQEQELAELYKRVQRAKKAKRLAQRRRGKRYKEPKGLKLVKQVKSGSDLNQQELKKLYREAMVHVHPDKFSMEEDMQGLATLATTQLIEIYESGDLQRMIQYHACVMKGHALDESKERSLIQLAPLAYLEQEFETIRGNLSAAKNRQVYQVLQNYADPMTYVVELQRYYTDRIAKLKKRTRKADKGE